MEVGRGHGRGTVPVSLSHLTSHLSLIPLLLPLPLPHSLLAFTTTPLHTPCPLCPTHTHFAHFPHKTAFLSLTDICNSLILSNNNNIMIIDILSASLLASMA